MKKKEIQIIEKDITNIKDNPVKKDLLQTQLEFAKFIKKNSCKVKEDKNGHK